MPAVVGGTVCIGAVVPGWVAPVEGIVIPELGGVTPVLGMTAPVLGMTVPLLGGVITTDEDGVPTVVPVCREVGVTCTVTVHPVISAITSSQLVSMPNNFFLFMGFPLSLIFMF